MRIAFLLVPQSSILNLDWGLSAKKRDLDRPLIVRRRKTTHDPPTRDPTLFWISLPGGRADIRKAVMNIAIGVTDGDLSAKVQGRGGTYISLQKPRPPSPHSLPLRYKILPKRVQNSG